jgi:hypothetical protein
MNIEILVGQTMASVTQKDDDEIIFKTTEGKTYKLHHYQDCCESVTIESGVGDLSDLVGVPILKAEESSGEVKTEDNYGSATWTFYKFATIKGYVDIRWIGESNGYYSESVDFEEVV